MTGKDLSERVLSALKRRLKEKGHGAIAQAQRHLGLGTSYFRDLSRGKGTLDLERLGLILEFLKVEPEEFFLEELRHPREWALGDFSEDQLPKAVRKHLTREDSGGV